MKAKWQSEKEAIEKMRTAKAELEQLRLQLDQARNAGDLAKLRNSIRAHSELQQRLRTKATSWRTFKRRRHAEGGS